MLHLAWSDKQAGRVVDMQAGPAERIADKQAEQAVLTARAADKPAADKPAVLQEQQAELTVRVLRERQALLAVQH